VNVEAGGRLQVVGSALFGGVAVVVASLDRLGEFEGFEEGGLGFGAGRYAACGARGHGRGCDLLEGDDVRVTEVSGLTQDFDGAFGRVLAVVELVLAAVQGAADRAEVDVHALAGDPVDEAEATFGATQ